MTGWCTKIAIFLPVLVVAAGLLLHFSIKSMVRFDVISPKVQPLEESQLNSLLATSKLLCVGCTNGIGEGLARAACGRVQSLVVVGRTKPDSLLAVCPTVEFIQADLSSLKTAKNLAKSFHSYSFDTVLFTVGITATKERKVSSEGIEMDIAVSFLSRYVIAREFVKESSLASSNERKARIFIMGFPGADGTPQLEDFNWEKTYEAWPAHKNGVYANDALVIDLAKKTSEVNVYGLNPGIIPTYIIADFLGGKESLLSQIHQIVIRLVVPSVNDYVKTLLPLLYTPEIEHKTGVFFNQYGEEIKESQWLQGNLNNVDKILSEAQKLEARALKV